MTIKELVKEAHSTAKEKGWYDTNCPRTILEHLMLMVSELSEAAEEYRKGNYPQIYQFQENGVSIHAPTDLEWDSSKKPEGIVVELADCIIRIADECGANGWDLEKAIKLKMAYNKTRPYRHGNKTA